MRNTQELLRFVNAAVPTKNEDRPHHFYVEGQAPGEEGHLVLSVNGRHYDMQDEELEAPPVRILRDFLAWYAVEADLSNPLYVEVPYEDASLPKAYKDFLSWAKHNAPTIFEKFSSHILPLIEEAVLQCPRCKIFILRMPEPALMELCPLLALSRIFRPSEYHLGIEIRKIEAFDGYGTSYESINKFFRVVALRELSREESKARREEHPDCPYCRDNPFTCPQHL
jgi:hypothetical protein